MHDLGMYTGEWENGHDLIYRQSLFFYKKMLMNNYKIITFLKNRGFKEKEIENVQWGYAPPSGQALKTFLLGHFNLNQLLKTGLVVLSKDLYSSMDRITGKIVIPMFNYKSSIVGFHSTLVELL